ncbi:response regulator [Paraburkholderia sp. SIMBA_009]|uniref:response regulator n=1 Tax=Paraburkholderia tropica TaxID=92647 RepID=UPI0013747CC8|nr:response regulator [Paraburkholderia tropica]
MAKVLLVEDDHRLLDATAALLEYSGHAAIRAENGAEGLRLARLDKVDLIITDYMMPVMDGLELASAVHSDPALNGIPVIVLSAVAFAPCDPAVRAFVRKPFVPGHLLGLVSEHALKRP